MADITRTQNLPNVGNQQDFYNVIETLAVSNVAQADLASTLKPLTTSTSDPSTDNSHKFNTNKMLDMIYRDSKAHKINMFKKPMVILDGEDYGELIRLGGEVDYNKDGTAEFASTDIVSTVAKYGTYSMDFNAGTECLLLPCKNKFKKENGTIAFWVYNPAVSKVLYENFAGFKVYTDANGYVNFRITESSVSGTSKATNTVTGTSDITTAAWWHVCVTWSNINSSAATGAMTLYIDGASEGSAITLTQIDVAGGEHGNQIIGAGRNDPTWTQDYSADKEPNDVSYGWTLTGTDSSSVSGGILTVDTIGDDVACYYTKTAAAKTFEMKARLNSVDSNNYLGMRFQTASSFYLFFYIYRNYVEIKTISTATPIDKRIPLDTTQYHVYRITNDGTTAIFYIDGIMVGSGVSGEVTSVMGFGDFITTADLNADIEYVKYFTTTALPPVSNQCVGYIDELAIWDHAMNVGNVVGVANAGETLYSYFEIDKEDYISAHEKKISEQYEIEQDATINSATSADITGYTSYVNSPGDRKVKISFTGEMSSDNSADQVSIQAAIDGNLFGNAYNHEWSDASENAIIHAEWYAGLSQGVKDIAIQWDNNGTNTTTLAHGAVSIVEV